MLAFRENKRSGRVVSGILALFWIWMGVFYHIAYFSTINPAARTPVGSAKSPVCP